MSHLRFGVFRTFLTLNFHKQAKFSVGKRAKTYILRQKKGFQFLENPYRMWIKILSVCALHFVDFCLSEHRLIKANGEISEEKTVEILDGYFLGRNDRMFAFVGFEDVQRIYRGEKIIDARAVNIESVNFNSFGKVAGVSEVVILCVEGSDNAE